MQTLKVYDATWQFDVAPANGWTPEWRNPCIAAVAVGSMVIALLQLRLLLIQERHAALLREMMPKHAIEQLHQGNTCFVEEIEW